MDSPNQPYDPDADVNRYLTDYMESPLRFTPPHNAQPAMGPPPPVAPMNDNADTNNDDEAGPSGTKEEIAEFQWVPPGALDCSYCNIVRQVEDHGNGLYNIAMSIHGVVSNLEHILIGVENTDWEITKEIDTYYFDLAGKSIESANEIFSKYGFQISEDGEIILQDSLLTIYNKILGDLATNKKPTGYPDYSSDSSGDWFDLGEEEEEETEEEEEPDEPPEFVDGEPWVEGPGESSNPAAPVNAVAGRAQPPRPSIGVQRERTANMTLMSLARYFHMKAQDAANELNLSTTTLKLVCRRLGLWRWPYRKIKSVDKKIETLVNRLEAKSEAGDTNGVVALRLELQRLKERRARFYHFLIYRR